MKLNLTKRYWADFILELLAVVLGITIAFWVDEWKVDRQERKLELKWLMGLRTDIEKTSEILLELRNQDSLANKSIENFIRLLDTCSADKITVDANDFFYWAQYFSFKPQINTFEAIKSSGKTHVIENQELLFDFFHLFILYEKTIEAYDGYNEWFKKWVDLMFIENVHPTTNKELMNKNPKVLILDLNKLKKFNVNRLLTLQWWYINMKEGTLFTYKENEEALKLIDKEITMLGMN